jgi:hypothetical protein
MLPGEAVAYATSDLFEPLTKFASEIASVGFDKCYVFGSLVNENGSFFQRVGPTESDIDLIIIFAGAASISFKDRCSACCHILPPVARLESTLHSMLERKDASKKICSILPVTYYELYHNINEGQDLGVYRTNQFISVPLYEQAMMPLCHGHDERYHVKYNELLLAIKHAQAQRKEFLATTPDGRRIGLPFSGTDIIPKLFMRRAALVRAWLHETTDKPARTELINGLEFLEDEIRKHADLVELSQTIAHRKLARGAVPELNAFHLLLLAELLFDIAKQSIPVTLREQVDHLIHQAAKN